MVSEVSDKQEYAEKLNALTSAERIEVVGFLREQGETTLDDLTEYMEGNGYGENVSVSLVHSHLPVLDEKGVIDYDGNNISYNEDRVVEKVFETLENL